MSAVDTGFRRYDKSCAERIAQMPDLLLRDMPRHIVAALERQTGAHGRSTEAEHRIILEEALRAGFWERADPYEPRTQGRISVPSAELIRRDLDER